MSTLGTELPVQRSRKNRWVVMGKLAVGLGLMTALVVRADITELLASLRSVNLWYLALMFALPHLMIVLSSVKWQMFLRELGLRLGLARLCGLYLIGTFFNNFLPTMIGGDTVRIYALGRDTGNPSAAVAATFLERLTGFAALVSLLPLVLLSDLVTTRFPAVRLLVPAVMVGFAAGVGLLLFPRWRSLLRPLRRIRLMDRVFDFLARSRAAVAVAGRSLCTLAATYAMSLVFYVGASACVWAAARSLGAHVRMDYLMATVPLVLATAMLPVSVNGLGITEAGFAIFLQLAGVPLPEAVGVGLLLRARMFVTAMIGGLVFLRYRTLSRQSGPPG